MAQQRLERAMTQVDRTDPADRDRLVVRRRPSLDRRREPQRQRSRAEIDQGAAGRGWRWCCGEAAQHRASGPERVAHGARGARGAQSGAHEPPPGGRRGHRVELGVETPVRCLRARERRLGVDDGVPETLTERGCVLERGRTRIRDETRITRIWNETRITRITRIWNGTRITRITRI
jgi:hypothetical protein